MFSFASIPTIAFLALTVMPAAKAQLRAAALDTGITLAMDTAELQAVVSTNMDEELFQMSHQAGVIFAGQVLAVRPHVDDSWGSGSGWVEIEFRIDQPVRGCSGQTTYTLREWSGLWAGGRQRYTVGQNLLVLLHASSASGLSSPVGGQEGIIPLTGVGAAPGPRDRFVNNADGAVDLRWVEARLLRPDASSQRVRPQAHEPRYSGKARDEVSIRETVGLSARRENDNASGVNRGTPGLAVNPISVPMAGSSGQGVTLRGIISMLMAWEAEQTHAAH